ncbi:MAG: phosphatase [Candidatus Sericytochromatia bacterium]|nr:phosphatase [Candidatus Sericytochromatia bacterium]
MLPDPEMLGLARLARRLETLGLAGQTPNPASANLRAIDRMRNGDPFYTFGINALTERWRKQTPDRSSIIDTVCAALGETLPERFQSGPGTIAAEHAARHWTRAIRLLDEVAMAGGNVSFGTGHPGAMLELYRQLADRVSTLGGHVIPPAALEGAAVDGWVDDLGGVAVLSDGCGALHSHSTSILDGTLVGRRVDLVVGDHGVIGSAMNAGARCLAFMDTNDPAVAVAASLLPEKLVLVPTYDNLPNVRTASILSELRNVGSC